MTEPSNIDVPSLSLIRQNHPELARVLASLSPEQWSAFVRHALSMGDESIAKHSTVVRCRAEVIAGDAMEEHERTELLAISKALDEEYFTLRDSGASEETWSAKFHEARLAYAVALVGKNMDQAAGCEIIYELAHAHASPEDFLRQLSDELQEWS